MQKLKLEDLVVTSFETAANAAGGRGTVEGHARPTQPAVCACQPTDPSMDCTYGCSRESACPDNCVIYSDFDCTSV